MSTSAVDSDTQGYGVSVAEHLLGRHLGRRVDFRRDDLTGVRFCDVPEGAFHLSPCHMWGLRAPGANFSGVGMTSTDFRFANLEGAIFSRANACGAKFWGANLRGADFRGARIKGAQFRGADLTGALFDPGEVLECTILPPAPHPDVAAEWGGMEECYRANPMWDFRGL